jgi:hypothetical protein
VTTAIDYTAATRTAESVLTTALDRWKDGVNSVSDQLRAFPAVGNLPQVDLAEAVERQFAFIQQVVDLNHRYARQLAEVATTLSGITRQQIESVSSALQGQAAGASDVARNGVDAVTQAVRDQADEVQQDQHQKVDNAAKTQRLERKEP